MLRNNDNIDVNTGRSVWCNFSKLSRIAKG